MVSKVINVFSMNLFSTVKSEVFSGATKSAWPTRNLKIFVKQAVFNVSIKIVKIITCYILNSKSVHDS